MEKKKQIIPIRPSQDCAPASLYHCAMSPPHAPRASARAAAVAAGQAADEDLEEADDAADDGVQDATNAADDGHDARADGAEQACDLRGVLVLGSDLSGGDGMVKRTYARDDGSHFGSLLFGLI